MRSSIALVCLVGSLSLAGCASPKTADRPPADTAATPPVDEAGDAPPPAGSDAALLRVDHTVNSISIDNKIGRRLLNIRIELSVAESEMPYILVVPTIEKETKQEFQLMTFRNDAAEMLIDPSAVHPKQVTIKARDSFGRAHEVTVPWSETSAGAQ